MKTKKHTILLALFSAILAFTFSSCKKDKDVTPVTTANGTLLFHMHTNADTVEVEDYGMVYTMSNNRKILVNRAQLYISNIQLVKLDGSVYPVAGTILLKKMEEEVYTIGTVPAGNYKSVRFDVGLGTATNGATPAAADSTLNQPVMWFGVTAQPSGFIFLNFEGSIDTTAAANGTVADMQPFNYRIGTNSNLKTVALPDQNYTVSPNQAQYVHLTIDYNKLFNGIALNQSSNLSVSTTAANSMAPATTIVNNIPLMFSYEE